MKLRRKFYSPDDYVPKVYGYGRVSHKGQFDKGNSVADQEARIRAYYEMRKSDETGPFERAEWGGMVAEPSAQSAFSREFARRPGGKELIEKLEPDDHIIVDKFDRLFRDMGDFVSQTKYFSERGIRLHFVNFMGMTFDSFSDGGFLMTSFMAIMSELESRRLSERITLARSRLRARARYQGTKPPFFCQLDPAKTRLEFKPWVPEMMEMVRKGESINEKMSALYGHCRDSKARRRSMQFRNFTRAWDYYNRPDVNTIRVHELVQMWKQKHREESE